MTAGLHCTAEDNMISQPLTVASCLGENVKIGIHAPISQPRDILCTAIVLLLYSAAWPRLLVTDDDDSNDLDLTSIFYNSSCRKTYRRGPSPSSILRECL